MTKNNDDDSEKLYPFRYVTFDDGVTSLLLDESMDMKWDVFESHNFLGNGHDWQRLIRTLLEDKAPEVLEALSFDSEAGMFCVRSSNQQALKTLAECVSVFYDDKEQMSDAVQRYAQYRDD